MDDQGDFNHFRRKVRDMRFPAHLSQTLAVVRGQDDDAVFVQPLRFQKIYEVAKNLIYFFYGRGVLIVESGMGTNVCLSMPGKRKCMNVGRLGKSEDRTFGILALQQ